jgi:hypothetical protein
MGASPGNNIYSQLAARPPAPGAPLPPGAVPPPIPGATPPPPAGAAPPPGAQPNYGIPLGTPPPAAPPPAQSYGAAPPNSGTGWFGNLNPGANLNRGGGDINMAQAQQDNILQNQYQQRSLQAAPPGPAGNTVSPLPPAAVGNTLGPRMALPGGPSAQQSFAAGGMQPPPPNYGIPPGAVRGAPPNGAAQGWGARPAQSMFAPPVTQPTQPFLGAGLNPNNRMARPQPMPRRQPMTA